MKQEIIALMADILKISNEKLMENFDTKEIWDSLTRVEILFAIEEEFDITFEGDEMAELSTPKALCDNVLEKSGE